MGILDLGSVIRAHAPRAIRKLALKDLAGTRVAVDVPLFGYSTFSAAFSTFVRTEATRSQLLEPTFGEDIIEGIRESVRDRTGLFIASLYAQGISPIFVFDGVASKIAEKSSNAHVKRAAAKTTNTAKLAELRAELAAADPLWVKEEDIDRLRSLAAACPPINPPVEMARIRAFAEECGVKVITAPNEAESFCSYLAAIGFASAVWTTDSDAHAFGAPVAIKRWWDGVAPPPVRRLMYAPHTPELKAAFDAAAVEIVVTPMVWKSLGMKSHAQFVDFCICLGCDFNSRIKGLGPAGVLKLYEAFLADVSVCNQSRVIEHLATSKPTLAWEGLNAERCREIFNSGPECEATFRDHAEYLNSSPAPPVMLDYIAVARDYGCIATTNAPRSVALRASCNKSVL